MIGFFDSGFGGLAVLKEVEKVLPKHSFMYLGDNARAPYGARSPRIIYQYTTEGVSYLFRHGANLVILACNTSSAVALRKIQQEWLPKNFPDKKVLGIIIPTAEEIDSFTKIGKVGILSTKATAKSGAYKHEIKKINKKVKVYSQACPLFVPTIEAGEHQAKFFSLIIKKYVQQLLKQEQSIDTIVLGCTHYAIIKDEIRQQVPKNIKLISQTSIIAWKLKAYLNKHSEIADKLDKQGKRIFLTTKNSLTIEKLVSTFYGQKIKLKTVKIKI